SPVPLVTPDRARVIDPDPPEPVIAVLVYASPTSPAGRTDGLRTTSASTVKASAVVYLVLIASDGVSVEVTVPAVVGVPEMVMVPEPSPEMVSPVPLVTPDRARVTGPDPPTGLIVWL